MSSMLVALVLVAPVALQCTPVGSVALRRRRLACSCSVAVAVAAAGG